MRFVSFREGHVSDSPAKIYFPSNTSRMFWHHIQCSQRKVGAMIPPPKKKRIKVERTEPKHLKEEDQSAGTFEIICNLVAEKDGRLHRQFVRRPSGQGATG